MRLYCAIPENIDKNETIVLPISMNQPLQRGERISAILDAIVRCGYKEQVTILICDYLNRYNCVDESEAFAQGDSFIQDHSIALQGFHTVRWKSFLDSLDQSEFLNARQEILNNSAVGTSFYNKIVKTWEKCSMSEETFEQSLQYQVEEYTAILCMHKFNHLFYPKRISNGMAYLYNFISGNKPVYHHIKVSEIKSDIVQITDLRNVGRNFSSSKNHLHIAFRALLQHMEQLLESQELSLKAKKIFAEEAESLLMRYGLLEMKEMKEKFSSVSE